jgi:hypothetical protein
MAWLPFAPRICLAQVLGNQLWCVPPNGMWAASRAQEVSARCAMAVGVALEVALSKAVWEVGLLGNKSGGGSGSGLVPKRRLLAMGPRPPSGSTTNGSRMALALFRARITNSLLTMVEEERTLGPLNFFRSAVRWTVVTESV